MSLHVLKTWPEFYAATVAGKKPFELRRNDRDFTVGDSLVLREFNPENEQYTGRQVQRIITYVLAYRPNAGCAATYGLAADYVILGLSEV